MEIDSAPSLIWAKGGAGGQDSAFALGTRCNRITTLLEIIFFWNYKISLLSVIRRYTRYVYVRFVVRL